MSQTAIALQERPSVRPRLVVEAAAASDVGLTRKDNQDRFTLRPDLGLFAVADGVAGRSYGEVAATMATELVAEFVAQFGHTLPLAADEPDPDMALLVGAMRHANALVHLAAQRQPYGRRMATTLVGALLEGDRVYVAHVGDSRAYRFRDQRLTPLTLDHSMANDLRALGISEEVIRTHARRHALSRAIGVWFSVDVSTRMDRAQAGDVLLLCSDGLTNMLDDDEIARVLAHSPDPATAARALVSAANLAGGFDNVTALVVRWRTG